jgi:hypothetical protein
MKVGRREDLLMTLTAELADADSPASRFLNERLPHRAVIVAPWADRIAALPEVVTSLPGHSRAAVGSAFDRRIGFDLADATPFPDVLNLIPTAEAERILTAAGLEPHPPAQASDTNLGMWRRRPAWIPPDIDEALDRDCWYLSQYARLLRRLRSPDPAASRSFYTALRQDVYRGDPQTEAVTAMGTLWRTYLNQARDRLLQLGRPRIISPVFDDSFAVGDLVLGSTLIEIKTYVDPVDALGSFLNQLLGYVLFDVDDRYAIDAIAVYLAWHGQVFTMPLAEVLSTASGQSAFDLDAARRDFRREVAPALEISQVFKHGPARSTSN